MTVESENTSDRFEGRGRETSPGRRGRLTSRRGSSSSLPVRRPPRASSQKVSPADNAVAPDEQATCYATLPGTLLRRDKQWWWEVQLPGEDEATARALTPDGAKAPTEDLETARHVALQLWERALTDVIERRMRAQDSETAARLKAQFLEKVRNYAQVVETTQARLEAETRARVEAEARLEALTHQPQPQPTVTCECCQSQDVPAADAQRIDSGQLLCPDCLAAFQAEVKRIDSQTLVGCDV